MQITHKIWLLLLFLTATSLQAQDMLCKKINIPNGAYPVSEVLKQITKRENYFFSYKSVLFSENDSIHVLSVETSEQIIKKICNSKKLTYSIIGASIILTASNDKAEFEPFSTSKKHTIKGYVKDNYTGESVIGAVLYAKEYNVGVVTNAYGFYSITLPEGEVNLTFSSVGYKSQILKLSLRKNRELSPMLSVDETMMDEVFVFADTSTFVTQNQMSKLQLPSSAFQKMPAFLGEKDVIKSLQTIPGISSYGDGSTNFFVRGGNRDQNLIIIDEAPIYNPAHMLGFFSSFIPEAITDVKVYKGDWPASFGERLSSVIDIKTKDGNMFKYGGAVDVGLFANRVSAEGPIIKGKSSFFTSYRLSNLKWLIIEDQPSTKLYFYDFNAKLNFMLSSRDRLFVTFYSGKDNFSQIGIDQQRSGIDWANGAGTIRWNHVFSDKVFANTTLYGSRYNYKLWVPNRDFQYWNSFISTISSKTDYTYYINPNNTFNFGGKFSVHYFNPGNLAYQKSNVVYNIEYVSRKNAGEATVYAENNQIINPRLSIKYGFRMPYWFNFGESQEIIFDDKHQPIDTVSYQTSSVYANQLRVEPRVNASYLVTSTSSVKISYARYYQFIHLLSNSISPFTTLEVWYPSTSNIKPQIADYYAAGYFKTFAQSKTNLSVEIFYKNLSNQNEFRHHANTMLNPLIESELRFGKGWAYGLEVMLKRDFGKTKGWIGYTYSRSFKKIEGINEGKTYRNFYDKPHDVNIYITNETFARWIFATNWIYTTGASFSSPTAYYNYQDYTVPYYGTINNSRLPDYHRLDIAATFRLNKVKKIFFEHTITLSVYNVYWRKNPYIVNFNKTTNADGDFVIPENRIVRPELSQSMIYFLGTIPSLTYNLKF